MKHYFWVCLWQCFWNRLVFELVNWEKHMALYNVGGHPPIQWAWNRTKSWRKSNSLSKSDLWYLSSLTLRHQCSDSWVFKLILGFTPSDSDQIIPLAFLILQFANSRSWDFSAAITTWANSYNKSPFIYLYVSYWFCFSEEPLTNTPSPHWYLTSQSKLTCQKPNF